MLLTRQPSPSRPPPQRRVPPDKALFAHVRRLASRYDATRRNRLDSVRTPEDWAQLAPVLREDFRRSFGEFPVRTPLNARTVGILRRSGYQIEKLVFESRPGFFVTANVYVPAAGRERGDRTRYPAVLAPVGHYEGGKAEPVVQAQCASLARKGFLVLVWDPLGQGERSQYWDPVARRDLVAGSTTQHTTLGNACALTGTPLANYMVWDGIRALDYLSSRPDVDRERIGCTGASGGGVQTMYLAILDERVKVAVPTLFVSSQRRWLEKGLIADSEQVSFGWLKHGLDHPEWCSLIAPRPLLLNAATGDFFPVSGTRETFREARRVYHLLGAQDAIRLRESEGGHVYTQVLREGAYRWFLSWLDVESRAEAGESPSAPDPAFALRCTRSGQVDFEDATTVFDLNRARTAELAKAHPGTLRSWRESPQRARRDILDALAIEEPDETVPAIEELDSEDGGDYMIRRLVYWREPDVNLPAALFTPKGPTRLGAAALVVDSGDRTGLADQLAHRLVARGFQVLSVQPRGMGEGRWEPPKNFGAYESVLGGEATLTHDAWLLGGNLVGWRVLDVLAGLRWLRAQPGVDGGRTFLVGADPPAATPALFSAALDAHVPRVALVRPLVSYRSVAETRFHRMPASLMPWGVLRTFDLPHVAAFMAQRPILMVNVLSASGEPARTDELGVLGRPADAGPSPEVIQGVQDPLRVVVDWLVAQSAVGDSGDPPPGARPLDRSSGHPPSAPGPSGRRR
jgi:dienelactone hydrolase